MEGPESRTPLACSSIARRGLHLSALTVDCWRTTINYRLNFCLLTPPFRSVGATARGPGRVTGNGLPPEGFGPQGELWGAGLGLWPRHLPLASSCPVANLRERTRKSRAGMYIPCACALPAFRFPKPFHAPGIACDARCAWDCSPKGAIYRSPSQRPRIRPPANCHVSPERAG